MTNIGNLGMELTLNEKTNIVNQRKHLVVDLFERNFGRSFDCPTIVEIKDFDTEIRLRKHLMSVHHGIINVGHDITPICFDFGRNRK